MALRVAGSAMADKSAPEQNCPPAPVSTATFSASSDSNRSKAARSMAAVGPSTAFLRSGRSRLMVATEPFVSNSTVGRSMEKLLRAGAPMPQG